MTLREEIGEIIRKEAGISEADSSFLYEQVTSILQAVLTALPEKKAINKKRSTDERRYPHGWNACLDTIKERLKIDAKGSLNETDENLTVISERLNSLIAFHTELQERMEGIEDQLKIARVQIRMTNYKEAIEILTAVIDDLLQAIREMEKI